MLKYDRKELRPEGFKGVSGGTVPHPQRPQPQPTDPFPMTGTPTKGNNGADRDQTYTPPSHGSFGKAK